MKETILSIKLKEYRINNNLTQSDLSEKLGVSDKTISKWELCRTYPSKKNMLKLSEILDISLETLLLEEKSDDTKAIDWKKLLNKLIRYIFSMVIIVYTIFNRDKFLIIIAIITSLLLIIAEYLEFKNKQKES
ncbi:helix-turn-helix domain-containing protein [Vagococcus zengguangii]|uniref:helix-turn-helix domain-containing protein n=1 Tax=Vagococcus zengguangii TaxID=2571750 RepID=UPI001107F79E|nr:helix-turn-helix transcriptional regulator [Vagococcus zengguangii]TLG80880.1 helix-turn-helix transcriptional regulator [Vagococcus zengguangii]